MPKRIHLRSSRSLDQSATVIVSIMTFACADMWIKADAMGFDVALTAEGADPSIVLSLPSQESRWFRDDEDQIVFNGYSTHVGGPLVSACAVLVRMQVKFQSSSIDESDPTKLADACSKLVQESRRMAEDNLARFLDHIRIYGQFWLGMSMQRPDLVDGPALYLLADGEEPRRLPGGGSLGPIYLDRPDHAVGREVITRVAANVAHSVEPDLAAVLLADAKKLARYDTLPNLRHAVLLAAVSAELRIKAALIAAANEDQAHLVQLLFDKPRDFSVAALALLDQPLKIVTGQSLKEGDPKLFKAAQTLFEVRNKIVHSGRPYPASDLYDAINASQRLGDYLAMVTGRSKAD